MLCSAKYIKSELENYNVLEKAFTNFPDYNLVITGKIRQISIFYCLKVII